LYNSRFFYFLAITLGEVKEEFNYFRGLFGAGWVNSGHGRVAGFAAFLASTFGAALGPENKGVMSNVF
jgi:hypothetical protein